MKTTMRLHRPESELTEAAKEMARTITIRTMNNGCSDDTTRKSTYHERKKLSAILSAALLALNEGEAARSDTEIERSILSTAEYMTLLTSSSICPETLNDPTGQAHINTYITIFIPLMDYIQNWRESSK